MAETKPLQMRVEDAITYIGALSGVWVNNPEQNFLVRCALTEAQQEICSFRRWKWLRSTGSFRYSANQSAVNMYSVSAGKFSTFGGFVNVRLGKQWELHERDAFFINQLEIGTSTAGRPVFYWQVGDSRYKFWPVPTTVDSVHFGFIRRPGFVYGGGDLIIPKQYYFNVLFRLARQKTWEAKGDPRRNQDDPTYQMGLQAMVRDDTGTGAGMPDMRPWHPRPATSYDPVQVLSGFYSTGRMP